MNFTYRIKDQFRKKESFLSKSLVSKFMKNLSEEKSNFKLTRDDSSSTIKINKKVSDSFNSRILGLKLKAPKYKRAESELRQIFTIQKIDRKKFDDSKRMTSTRKYSNAVFGKKGSRRFDSSLNSKEANLILDEYRNVNKPEIWDSLIENFKTNPKQLLELIPISLTTKNANSKTTPKITSARSQSPPRNLQLRTLIYNQNFCNSPNGSPTPDIIETLNEKDDKLTEDWAKSLLYYNLKHNQGNSNFKDGFSEHELKNLLFKLPSNTEMLNKIYDELLITLEHLLTELLGTKQDCERFKAFFDQPIPSILKNLIVKCLDLYKLRRSTIDILQGIRKREKMIKELVTGDKAAVILIHQISKKIRNKINNWLKEKICPFKEFIYKENNYLQKIDMDLIFLQSALSPRSKEDESTAYKNFNFFIF